MFTYAAVMQHQENSNMLSSIQNASLYARANKHFKAGEFAQAAPLFEDYLATRKESSESAKPGSKYDRAQEKLTVCHQAPTAPAETDTLVLGQRPRTQRSQTAPSITISAPYNVHKPFSRFDPTAIWPERSVPASPRTPLSPRFEPNMQPVGTAITTDEVCGNQGRAAVTTSSTPNTPKDERRRTQDSVKSWQSTSSERADLAEALEAEIHRVVVARRAPARLTSVAERENFAG
jgi:hypothetical protein